MLSYCLKLDSLASLDCATALLNKKAHPDNCVDVSGEGLLHRAVRYGEQRHRCVSHLVGFRPLEMWYGQCQQTSLLMRK